ncbi:MAG: hypothetical protein HYS26_04420 [Candidatus Kaiserbacteria bacterium]|nr:MAG: hypothetical protein HYS26_04420 [Candidatus Kaiserbacteria bacterium]
MTFAIIVFLLSLFGILSLFGLKRWEESKSRTLAPALRGKLDAEALRLKDLLFALQKDLEKLPPETLHLARILVHKTALGAASVARGFERQAHRLADLVSHKGRFTRRAPRSEFLQKVIEHKNGSSGDSQDETTRV